MFGNALDMRGHVDSTFHSDIPGGIWLIRKSGGYTAPGGVWEDQEDERRELTRANIQPAKWREISLLVGEGGVAVLSDFRIVHINDGVTYLMPDETGRFSDLLAFSDGTKTRLWRIREADNRPWRNFCRAVVEIVRESPV